MVESMRLYHPAGTSDEKIAGDVAILERLGYLRRLPKVENTYEVRRIIKALVTADWIAEYSNKLLASARPDAGDDDAFHDAGTDKSAPDLGAAEHGAADDSRSGGGTASTSGGAQSQSKGAEV